MHGYRYCCLHCLSEDSAVLKVDKKGRPYSFCFSCMTRAFIPSREGLRGIRLVAPGLVEIYRSMHAKLPVEDKASDAFVRELRQQKHAMAG